MSKSKADINLALVEKLRMGDEAAMKHIFRLYYPRLRYFSISLIEDYNEAEDIVQEAFLNFWINVKQKEVSPANIQAYLYRLVRNRCLNHLQRRQMLDERSGEVFEKFYQQVQRQMDDLALRAELYSRVSRKFSGLTPIQVQIITLLYDEGLSVQEIAAQLNTTPNNVRNHKARALERLKTLVKGELLFFILIFCNFF